MKYIPADKLIAEIERRKAIAKLYDMSGGDAPIYDELLSIIESLQQEQPSLPSNLDEAAEEQYPNPNIKRYTSVFANEEWTEMEKLRDAFKAGAEWMAGQGWSRELEVKEDAGGYPYIDKHIELYDYDTDTPLAKKGDKVVVQIRKK